MRFQFYIVFLLMNISSCEKNSYHLGFMVNDINLEKEIDAQINNINADPRAYGVNKNIHFNESVHLLESDAINITTDICDRFISNQIYIMMTTNPNSTKSPSIVSYACAFYTIPVIAIQARETEYSDKSLHPTTLRMVPSYSDQARVITKVIQFFKLNKVNVIASNDFDGRNTYIRFTTFAYKSGISIENTVIVPKDESDVKSYVKALSASQSKVVVLLSNTESAVHIYKSVKELGMSDGGYIWIANEQSLSGDAVKEAPPGVVAVVLQEDIQKTISQAIDISVKAISKLYEEKRIESQPAKSCDEPARDWETGKNLYSALINSSIDGISFDWNGDSLNATYNIVNLQINQSANERILVKVGEVNEHASLDTSKILWPGGLTEIPSGLFVSTFLKIVTVRSKPFVYTIKNTTRCSDIVEVNSKGKRVTFIPCKDGNVTMCCKGYCMELLKMLADRLNFTYELHLVADGQFGSLKKVADSNIKRWNGMVGEVIEGKADLIVASLTINNERAQYIEFSKPFKYQGITILVKSVNEEPGLASFLRPFKTELWILVLISVHVVALILYLLDRLSPFGRYRLAQANKEENALNLSSAMWFSWGVLLNSGIGEGTPRSFSARVLGMVWAGFAMIIVASYTANLAAFLVLDRPKPVATGIDDPKLRNPSEIFKYATVTNSSVDAYFRRQVELSAMYTHMTKYNVKNDSDGIAQVKSKQLQAFIWDSPVLFHETSNDCDLVTVGDLFGRSGYGIGMPKGFAWSENISLSILHFHESGAMEELESTWINFGNCETATTSATTLGLKHMLGVFIMVAGGIGAGIVIVILEVLYYKHKGWRKQQQKVLKKTTEQWQEHVLDKKNERQNNSKVFNRDTAQRRSVKFNDVDTQQQIGVNNPTFDNNRENANSSH